MEETGVISDSPEQRTFRPWAALGIGAAVVLGGGALAWALSNRPTPSDEEATYPPLDTPKPFAEGVWIVDSGPLDAMGLKLPVRMVVIRLSNGELFLHSPTRFTPELAEALRGVGTVRHLVAPNIAHWIYLADWQRAFPEATTWGAPGLRSRAQVRASDVRIDVDLAQDAPPAWFGEINQGLVAGAGFNEVWFFHPASRTLLLVDLIENLEVAKLSPLAATVMRTAAATQGTTARYLRPAIRLGGAAAKESIRAAIACAPERVLFAHGAPFENEGTERLRHAFAWLL